MEFHEGRPLPARAAWFAPVNEPTLIIGSSTRKVDGKLVTLHYSYMAARSTLFDEQLIHFAERRDAELKRRRVA